MCQLAIKIKPKEIPREAVINALLTLHAAQFITLHFTVLVDPKTSLINSEEL